MAEGITEFKEMLYLLGQGRFLSGDPFDPEVFEERSDKSLLDLFREQLEQDSTLAIDPEGYIRRFALSTKTLIYNPAQGMALREVQRMYTRTMRTQKTGAAPYWSIRETRKRGETAKDAAIRGYLEEHGRHATPDQIRERIIHGNIQAPDLNGLEMTDDIRRFLDIAAADAAPFQSSPIPRRASTVYYGIYSEVVTEWFELHDTDYDCNGHRYIHDGPTTMISLEPFAYMPSSFSNI